MINSKQKGKKRKYNQAERQQLVGMLLSMATNKQLSSFKRFRPCSIRSYSLKFLREQFLNHYKNARIWNTKKFVPEKIY